MTFLEGFAQGYGDASKARLEREAQKEDTQFRYGMDFLVKQREKRDEKKLKETEMANQSKIIAQQVGDPDFAPTAMQHLKLGTAPDKLIENYTKGNFKKNPKFVAPTTTIKVPTGVEPEYDTYGENFLPNVKKQIDELDPTLRKVPREQEDLSTLNSEQSQYLYQNPEEVKIGPYEQASYELELAIKNKDPVKIADAKLKISAHENALTRKAVIEAKAQKKNVVPYVMLDDNGEIISRFAGEKVIDADGAEVLKNVSNNQVDGSGNPVNLDVLAQQGKVVEFSEKDAEKLFDLQNRYGKQSADFNNARDKFTGALTTIKTIDGILTAHPEVTTMSSDAAVFVKSLQDEAGAAYSMIANEQNEIDSMIENGVTDGLGGKIAELEESTKEFSDKFMAQANTDIALAKALYEGQRKLLSYQMAGANGISGAGMSKKDQENFYDTTGGNKSAPEVMEAIKQTSYSVYNVLKSSRDTLNQNKEVEAFEGWTHVKTGLIQNDRLEDHFLKVDPTLEPIVKMINSANKTGAFGALQGRAAPDATVQNPAQQQAQPTPTVLPGSKGIKYQYVGPQPMTEELRKNKNNWKEVAQ